MFKNLMSLTVVLFLVGSAWAGSAPLKFNCQVEPQSKSTFKFEGIYYIDWLKEKVIEVSFQVPVQGTGLTLQGDFIRTLKYNDTVKAYTSINKNYSNIKSLKPHPNPELLFAELKAGEAFYDIKQVTLALPEAALNGSQSSIEFIVTDKNGFYLLLPTTWTCKSVQ